MNNVFLIGETLIKSQSRENRNGIETLRKSMPKHNVYREKRGKRSRERILIKTSIAVGHLASSVGRACDS